MHRYLLALNNSSTRTPWSLLANAHQTTIKSVITFHLHRLTIANLLQLLYCQSFQPSVSKPRHLSKKKMIVHVSRLPFLSWESSFSFYSSFSKQSHHEPQSLCCHSTAILNQQTIIIASNQNPIKAQSDTLAVFAHIRRYPSTYSSGESTCRSSVLYKHFFIIVAHHVSRVPYSVPLRVD